MMRNLLTLFVMLILLTSCFKTKKQITGKVYNPITGVGIAHPTITFSIKNKGKSDLYSIVEQVTGNTYGDFTIEAKARKPMIANVVLDPAKYYLLGWYDNGGLYDTIIAAKKSKFDFQAVPYAHSKLIVNNINCQGASDSIIIYQSDQLGTIDADFAWVQTGCINYESDFSNVLMGEFYYKWVVIRNGIKTYFSDTVFFNEDEFKTYIINY